MRQIQCAALSPDSKQNNTTTTKKMSSIDSSSIITDGFPLTEPLTPNEIPDAAPLSLSSLPLSRPNAPRARFSVPAEVVHAALTHEGGLPVDFVLDGSGPFVWCSVGEWSQSLSNFMRPADIQKDIFEHGQRYWKKWIKFAAAAANVPTSAAVAVGSSNRRTTWILLGAVVLLFTIVTISLVVVFAKRKKQWEQYAPPRIPPVADHHPAFPPLPPMAASSSSSSSDRHRFANLY